ncbi:MAG: amidohydrolase family protein [Candidatus Bathyarchaeia archaeon]
MVKNGFIVTMDESDRLLRDGAIYIEGSKIIDIGETRDLEKTYKADEVIDASNGVVIPGFVNSHVHFTSVLRRGVEDDLPLEQWLGTLSRGSVHFTSVLSEEELAAAFRLVCLEMIKAGITCYSAGSGMLRERYETGLRGLHSLLITDEIGDYESILQRIQEDYSDRFHFGFLTPLLTMVPEGILLEMKEIAERHNLKIHMHVAESRGEIQEIKWKYGCDGSVEYLDHLGLLSPRLVAAHCVHVSLREIDLMRRRGVGVAHCPVSNAKLGDGVAPLADLLKAGITLGLGSDGPATNNCIDMFQEMKFACLLQRAARCDPTVVKAGDVLRMATIGGAKLLGMSNEIGSLEVGKKADLILVNFEKPHLYPKTSIISHLVYSAKASDVDTTIVNGKVLMRNRRILTMDETSVLQKAQEVYESISSREEER